MKLYIISQDENDGYDTYDSALVAAESEEDARTVHPSLEHDFSNPETVWEPNRYSEWCSSPDKVLVRYVGEAAEGIARGVLLTSFNAG